MPNELTSFTSTIDALTRETEKTARTYMANSDEFGIMLSALENEKAKTIDQQQLARQQKSQQVGQIYTDVVKLEKQLNEAGPFHNLISFFTGEDSTDDMIGKQQLLNLQARQIAIQDQFDNENFATKFKKLDMQTEYARYRRQSEFDRLQQQSQLINVLSNNQNLKQVAQQRFVENKYTYADLLQMHSSGVYPQGVDPGMVEQVMLARRNLYGAGRKGKEQTTTEKMLGAFGNNETAFLESFATQAAKGPTAGFFETPEGTRFPMTDARKLAKSIETSRTQDQLVLPLTTPYAGANDMQLAVAGQSTFQDLHSDMQGVFARSSDVFDEDHELAAQRNQWQVQALTTQNDIEIAQRNWKDASPESRAKYSQVASQHFNGLAAQAIELRNKIAEKKAAAFSDKEEKQAMIKFAKTGSFGNTPGDAAGNVVLQTIMPDVTDAQKRKQSGLVMAKPYNNFLTTFQTVIEDHYQGSEPEFFDKATNRLNMQEFLAYSLSSQNKSKVPVSLLMRKAMNQMPIDEATGQAKASGNRWESEFTDGYITGVVSHGILEVASEMGKIDPMLRDQLIQLGRINPVTGLSEHQQLDDLVNAFTKLDADLQASGKLKPEQSVMELLRQKLAPSIIANENGEVVPDAMQSAWIDNAIARVQSDWGDGMWMVNDLVFKGQEKFILQEKLAYLFDKNKLDQKARDVQFNGALQEALKVAPTIHAEVLKDLPTRDKAFGVIVSAAGKDRVLNELSATLESSGYSKETIAEVLSQIDVKDLGNYERMKANFTIRK